MPVTETSGSRRYALEAPDQIDAAVAFLDDLRTVLDGLRGLPRLSLADVPLIRQALADAARYRDVPLCPCGLHHMSNTELARRYEALLASLGGEPADLP